MSRVDLAKHAAENVQDAASKAAHQAYLDGLSPSQQLAAARRVTGQNLQYTSHFGEKQQRKAWERILKKHGKTNFIYTEDNCPGHIGWEFSNKFCGRCGIHTDSLRPPEDGE